MTQGRWWLPIATGLAGLAAGWFLAVHLRAQPEAGTAAFAAPIGATSSDDRPRAAQGPTLEDLRRVVREELAAAGASAGAGRSPGSDPTPSSPEPTDAQVAAGQGAHQVLDGAIARGRFTDNDIDALKDVFHQLTTQQQAEVLQRYAVAVNQGRIVPETARLPF